MTTSFFAEDMQVNIGIADNIENLTFNDINFKFNGRWMKVGVECVEILTTWKFLDHMKLEENMAKASSQKDISPVRCEMKTFKLHDAYLNDFSSLGNSSWDRSHC